MVNMGLDEINTGNPLALRENYELQKRYRIGNVLGAGGFGITYKAYDLLNHTFCAIKEYVPLGICVRDADGAELLPGGSDKTEEYLHGKERFMNEAAILLEVADIPNIVRLTDYFEGNGTAYYVMEYLEGCTLKQLQKVMPDKKVPLPEACEIIQMIGKSLEKVHDRKNLLHRDISPDNIFLTKDQRIKLIDFGSAKHVSGQSNQMFSVLLKRGFAPPEQYKSNSKQGRYTDVYALASTFYCIVCGKMLPDSMERVAGTPYTPVWEVVPGMSKQMSAILDKALQLDYRTRYQTVGEFIEELRQAYYDMSAPGVNKSTLLAQTQDEKIQQEMKKPRRPMATWRQGDGTVRQVFFRADVLVKVGRSELQSQIVIGGYMEVSKIHCYIQFDSQSGKFLVKDVSTNGTAVNGQQLRKGMVYAVPEGYSLVMAGRCVMELGVG